jgi:hypothetical protein
MSDLAPQLTPRYYCASQTNPSTNVDPVPNSEIAEKRAEWSRIKPKWEAVHIMESGPAGSEVNRGGGLIRGSSYSRLGAPEPKHNAHTKELVS